MWNERPPARARRQAGFTLIEMIIAIVVIGVGLAGVMMAFSTVAKHNADPLVSRQMLAIAKELMEEIQLKPYAHAATALDGCRRAHLDDVADFNGYASTNQICDIEGTPIAALAGYSVAVAVSTGSLGGVTGRQITITVTRGSDTVSLVGWRTDYGD